MIRIPDKITGQLYKHWPVIFTQSIALTEETLMDFWDGFIIGYLLTSDKNDNDNSADDFIGSLFWGFIVVGAFIWILIKG